MRPRPHNSTPYRGVAAIRPTGLSKIAVILLSVLALLLTVFTAG